MVGKKREAGRGVPVLILWGVLAVALIRLASAAATLPYVNNPDEPWNVWYGKQITYNGPNLPPMYMYPSVNFEVLGTGAWLLDKLPGTPAVNPHMENLGTARIDGASSYFLLRLFPILANIGTLLLAIDLARRLVRRSSTLYVTLAVMGLSYLGVENGYIATPDAPASFFVMLALWGAARYVFEDADRWLAVAMVGGALATTTKYQLGGVAFFVLGAAIASKGWRVLWSPALAKAIGWGTLAAFVSMPGLVLDTARVWRDIQRVRETYVVLRPNAPGNGWWYNAMAVGLAFGPVLLLAVAGLVGLRNRPKPTRIVMMMVGSYVLFVYVFHSIPRNQFDRNLLQMVAPMAVLAAVGTDQVAQWMSTQRPQLQRWLVGIVALACLPMAVVGVQRLTRVLHDPRREAGAYIARTVPEGSTIGTENYAPYLPRGRYTQLSLGWTPEYRGELPRDLDAVVLTKQGSQFYRDDPKRFATELKRYDEVLTGFCLDRRFDDGPYWAELYLRCGS